MSETIIAIDFGTSNSLVGAYHQGRKISFLNIDENHDDPTIMRTLLYFSDRDHCYYGSQAIQQYIENDLEGRLFRSFKTHLPNQAYLGTVIDNRILSLEVMIGLFLLEIKKRSEKILGCKVEKAIIGRPARYSYDDVAEGVALHRMKKAAEYAGFREVQFVAEPLAAAFEYRKHHQDQKNVLIADFGGGTTDFTIIKIHPGEFQSSDVLAVEGCPKAGDALDSLFMSQKLNQYFAAGIKYQMPLSNNILKMPPTVTDRLNQPSQIVHLKDKETYEFIKEVRKCALNLQDQQKIDRLFTLIEDNQIFSFFENIEKVKRQLSVDDKSIFQFDYPDIEIHETFHKAEFINWSEPIKTEILQSLSKSMTLSGLRDEEIDMVCLTGGTSKVPHLREIFSQKFGQNKIDSQAAFHSVVSGLVEAAELWALGRL